MRIAILAGAVALAAPLAVEARTVTVTFDGLDFYDTSYEEQGFVFSNFDSDVGNANGLDSYGGGFVGLLELQDGGTGTTNRATVTAADGSAFTLLSANVRGVQRSATPYNSGLIEGTLNGEDAGSISYSPPDRARENVSFDFGPVDRLDLSLISYTSVGEDCFFQSPCSSIFYDDITFEVDDVAPVPLPASAPLIVMGLAALGWARRRRA